MPHSSRHTLPLHAVTEYDGTVSRQRERGWLRRRPHHQVASCPPVAVHEVRWCAPARQTRMCACPKPPLARHGAHPRQTRMLAPNPPLIKAFDTLHYQSFTRSGKERERDRVRTSLSCVSPSVSGNPSCPDISFTFGSISGFLHNQPG